MKYKIKIETGTKKFIVGGKHVSYKKYRYFRASKPGMIYSCERIVSNSYYIEGNKLVELYKDVEVKMIEFYSKVEHPINPMNDDTVVYDFFNSIRIY